MYKNTKYIFVILFLLLLTISIYYFINNSLNMGLFDWVDKDINMENFYIDNYDKAYCSSCGYKNRSNCNNCVNCGYCINEDGYGECVPGDANGPYFRKDCAYYEYNNPYYSYGAFPYYYPYNYPKVDPYSVYPLKYWWLRRRYPHIFKKNKPLKNNLIK